MLTPSSRVHALVNYSSMPCHTGAHDAQVNSELTGIELDACDIDDDGACALAAALASDGAPRLQWLLLNDHARLGDRGVVAIARSIAAQPQLRGLALSMCKYSDAGVAALCAALETNESVTSLNLFGNRLSDAGSDRLRDAIAVNATLERVQMPVSRPELSELPPLEERHEARAAFLVRLSFASVAVPLPRDTASVMFLHFTRYPPCFLLFGQLYALAG